MEAISVFLRVLDLIGAFVFALSGATMGVRRNLDLFGVLVLAFATAVSGGIARDLLLGSVPPVALTSWHYLALSILAGILTFRFHPAVERLQFQVQVFDAAGLGLFAVVGTTKALAYGLEWPMAAVLGMLSGIGGGVVRDVLSGQIPSVLRSEVYAIAALAGGLVVALGSLLHLPGTPVTLAGAALCFLLRLVGIYRRWNLPVARKP